MHTEQAWLVVSGWRIREGTVLRREGGLALFRFKEGGGIRIPESRLYASLQEAQAGVRSTRRVRGPWRAGHFQGNAWIPE